MVRLTMVSSERLVRLLIYSRYLYKKERERVSEQTIDRTKNVSDNLHSTITCCEWIQDVTLPSVQKYLLIRVCGFILTFYVFFKVHVHVYANI